MKKGVVLLIFCLISSYIYADNTNILIKLQKKSEREHEKHQETRKEWSKRWIKAVGGDSASHATSSLKYGCEFYCEGQFGLKRSETFRVNTPYINSADAQEYVRKEYEAQCKRYPFFSSGGGASVSYPRCETYHYKD